MWAAGSKRDVSWAKELQAPADTGLLKPEAQGLVKQEAVPDGPQQKLEETHQEKATPKPNEDEEGGPSAAGEFFLFLSTLRSLTCIPRIAASPRFSLPS